MLIRAEFDMDGLSVALNIQDTGGSYVDDFPAMVELSLQSADAVILGNKEIGAKINFKIFHKIFHN